MPSIGLPSRDLFGFFRMLHSRVGLYQILTAIGAIEARSTIDDIRDTEEHDTPGFRGGPLG
jgi:hypothetical protein